MILRITLFSYLLLYSLFSHSQINEEFKTTIEEGLAEIIEDYDAIGISVAIISGDDEWIGAEGFSSSIDSLNTDHVFAIGSITKILVSGCILGLMEEGKINLNDPIELFLENRTHIDSSITIKDLLQHTSGIYNFTDHPLVDSILLANNSKVFEIEELLDLYLLEPSFIRGSEQSYSNTNYLLLGEIIEKITNRPYYIEIIERFQLEENYPSLSVAPQITNPLDLAHLWLDLGDGKIDIQQSGISLNAMFSHANSAGAFVAKPIDIARFGKDFLSGKFLNQSSMDSIFNFHPFKLWGEMDYGLGVSRNEAFCGVSHLGHSGGIGYTANLAYNEEYNLTVVVMTNDSK
ncbi:MAG: serine hydrolase domain-containing protein, partial [Bacteroidota bacterium]